MRQLLRTILRILDGSPNRTMTTQTQQRGQSLLELALITPLLAILVAGAVEVGWYTNRWLTLLEITRVGARSATFLQGELSPLNWDNNASIHPDIQTNLLGVDPAENSYLAATNSRQCETGSNYGFYSYIVCVMEQSLQPLELRINEADDIVVSVFSIQTVNNARKVGIESNEDGVVGGRPIYQRFSPVDTLIEPVSATSNLYKITYDLNDVGGFGAPSSTRTYPPGKQNIVIGRYPINANECTNMGDETNNTVMVPGDLGFEIDPFDYLNSDNGTVTAVSWGGREYVLELRDIEGNPLADSTTEYQRGFSYLGQHQIDDPNVYCFGSEFTNREVEELINMPEFIQPDIYDSPADTSSPAYFDWVETVYESEDEREFFEPQGITLVEVFWEHDFLLNFPLFRPLQQAYDDQMVIALWSAFPLPSASPNITYQLP